MNGPRIQNDERGITLNKSLAWSIMVGLIGAALWLGSEQASVKSGVDSLQAQISEQMIDTRRVRQEVDSRLRILEQTRASDASEIAALRRDLGEFRTDVRELTGLIRRLEQRLNE